MYIESGLIQYNIVRMGERREGWRVADPIFINST